MQNAVHAKLEGKDDFVHYLPDWAIFRFAFSSALFRSRACSAASSLAARRALHAWHGCQQGPVRVSRLG